MRRQLHCYRSSAFTLVELLVVIGIIALLIAILLPAVMRAKEMANRIKCVSNVRQISMAWLMYTNENRGHFPLPQGMMINGRPGIYFGWLTNSTTMVAANDYAFDVTTGALWPYLRSKEVYICPSDQQRRTVEISPGVWNTAAVGFSYGLNGADFTPECDAGKSPKVPRFSSAGHGGIFPILTVWIRRLNPSDF